MTRKNKVAIFAVFITLTHFSSNAKGDERSKNYNKETVDITSIEKCYMDVRVTKYHKSDRRCDLNTFNEESSTGIKLREGNSQIIGTIAADEKVIPIGSLVLVTTKNGDIHPYLCADKGGTDVIKRTASRILAKREKRDKEWATRPVVDIYSSRVITNDWSTILVIKDYSLNNLKGSEKLKRLKERLYVDYWMSRGLDELNKNQLLVYNK